MNSSLIERLKAIPITDVAYKLGLKLTKNRMHCFNPQHTDKTPSLTFNIDKNYFHCFGCNIGGSTIELVMSYNGFSRNEAIRWLAQEFGYSQNKSSRLVRQKRILNQHTVIHKETSALAVTPDHEVYAWIIDKCDLPAEISNYLEGRGFSDDTIAHFNIKGHLKPVKLISEAEDYWGKKRLIEAGLFNYNEAREKYIPVWWDAVVIVPFYNESSKPFFLQARRLNPIKGSKYVGLSGIPKPLFNSNIVNTLPVGSKIYIVEGVMDVLAAHTLNMNAIGVLGATTKLQRAWAEALNNFSITVMPDNDQAGMKFKESVIDAFWQIGKSINVEYLPSGINDLSELLSKREAFIK